MTCNTISNNFSRFACRLATHTIDRGFSTNVRSKCQTGLWEGIGNDFLQRAPLMTVTNCTGEALILSGTAHKISTCMLTTSYMVECGQRLTLNIRTALITFVAKRGTKGVMSLMSHFSTLLIENSQGHVVALDKVHDRGHPRNNLLERFQHRPILQKEADRVCTVLHACDADAKCRGERGILHAEGTSEEACAEEPTQSMRSGLLQASQR